MASSRRQRVVTDPAPVNGSSDAATFGLQGGLGSAGGDGFPQVFSTATVAGNTLVAYQEIAAVGGIRVSALVDTVGNTYTQVQNLLNTSFGLGGAVYVCSNAASVGTGDRGAATGGSTTTIVDTTKSWTTNQWAGRKVCNYSSSTTVGTVTSNTATTLTVSWTQSAAAGNYYCVGDWISFQYTGHDDYWGGFVDEIQGVTTSSYITSSSAQGSFSAGTNNLSTGAVACGSSPCYLWALAVNDEDSGSTPYVPLPNTADINDGGELSFDLGQPIVATSHHNFTNPGTTDMKFSAQNADHFQMFMVALLDASSGVTVGLTGQAVGCQIGAVSGGNSPTFSGSSATAHAGGFIPGIQPPLTGTAIASASGHVTPSTSVAFVGSTGTFTPGTNLPGLSPGLLGSQSLHTPGSVVPSLSAPLVGLAQPTQAGILVPSGGQVQNNTTAPMLLLMSGVRRNR